MPSRQGPSGSFSQRIALCVSELIRHACRKRAGSERRKEEKPSGNVFCSLVSVQNAAGCRPLQFFGPGMLAVLPAGGTDGEQSSTANELLQSSPSQDLLQGGPGLFGSLLVRLQASVTAVFSPIAPAGKTNSIRPDDTVQVWIPPEIMCRRRHLTKQIK